MKKAGELLGAFFDESVLRAARGYSELFTAWRSLVGEKIAAHSRIAELDKSILLVEADHPGWIQILQTKQASILESAKRRFPELSIAGISFRLAKDGSLSSVLDRNERVTPGQQAETTDSEPQVPPETQTASGNEDPYSKISDPTFKEVLIRLEKSISAKNKTR